MARGDSLDRHLIARIEQSGLTLTVQYPSTRPVATGASPAPAPISPFTAPAPTTQIVQPAGTPAKSAVTLPCLWLDAYGSVAQSMSTDRIRPLNVGWVAGASALARVTVKAAALDSTKPLGDTVFTGADHVEFGGGRYRILSVQPVGSSFRPPVSYYVWLVGAIKQ
jgi:hypothetical protein